MLETDNYRNINGHELEQTLGDSEGQEAWCAQFLGLQRVRHNLVTEQQQKCHSKFYLMFGIHEQRKRLEN